MGTKDKKLEYQVKPKDLEKCFKFSVKYHLSVGGGSYNRTTGQYRGLGEKIDSFCIGKIIEIGVASIVERFTNKKMLLDFYIHGPTDDPDIITVKEGKKERAPELHIEIKNSAASDRWTGLSKEQFTTTLKMVSGDAKKAFVVYALLFSKDDGTDRDLLGAYLKTKFQNKKLFKKFCKLKDLRVTIEYVLTLEELKKNGIEFKEGSYMYETDIFKPVTERTFRQIINPKNRGIFKPLAVSAGILPVVMRDNNPKPKEFGKFKYKGDLKIFLKKNLKSKRMYIHSKADVIISNEVLGDFKLEKGMIYECFFTTLGRSPVLKRDNIWIAKRNLANVLSGDRKEGIKKIAEKI